MDSKPELAPDKSNVSSSNGEGVCVNCEERRKRISYVYWLRLVIQQRRLVEPPKTGATTKLIRKRRRLGGATERERTYQAIIMLRQKQKQKSNAMVLQRPVSEREPWLA